MRPALQRGGQRGDQAADRIARDATALVVSGVVLLGVLLAQRKPEVPSG